MPSALWEATLLLSVVTDAAPKHNAGASGSLHAEISTPVGPDTQPSSAGPSLPAGQGRQLADVAMTASMVGDVPAAGDTMQS